MTKDQKAKLIAAIIYHLKFHAKAQRKAFCEGSAFLSLAFKSDKELAIIAKLAGV